MRQLHLTQDDVVDLLGGYTINTMVEDGEELATKADLPLLHIVAIGNPFDGLSMHGPFGSPEEAGDWAADQGDPEYHVVAVNYPHSPEGSAS